MNLSVEQASIKNVLTRTTGYLLKVASHSLQPYRGCSYGRSLCGVGCYVQHHQHLLRGRAWGSFLEARVNAAQSYLAQADREAAWARGRGMPFSIFCSSATDPFVPQEFRYGITRSLFEAMLARPPDALIVQTHTHLVCRYLPLLTRLHGKCQLRVHLSIETDREVLEGLPPHASPVARRLQACRELKEAGITSVVTVAPLLPILDPPAFFARIAACACAVVIDHYIEGDGSAAGSRTLRTPLPRAILGIDPAALALDYRDAMAAVAREAMPGRVGVGQEGFAGLYA
jgi:DNA repair photolyase